MSGLNILGGGNQQTDPFQNPSGFSTHTGGWLDNFARSALWSMGPGLVGVEPPLNLERWQAENPGSAFGAGMLGMAVPYLGWAKATTAPTTVGRFMGRAMERVAPAANMATTPVRTAAMREVVRFAPLEAARVASAPVLGPAFEQEFGGHYRGAWDVAASAGTDLVLGGALGGIFGGLSAYGRKHIAKRGIRSGVNLNAPLQVQLRELRKVWESGAIDASQESLYQGGVNRLKKAIVEETAPKDSYFSTPELNERLSPLFTPKAKTKLRVGKINSQNLFQRDRILDALENLPEDWQAYTKFPRIVQARKTGNLNKNAKNQKAVDDLIGKLPNGGRSVRWDWLPEENTFVVAKKLTDTDWLTFKTDKPDMFLPEEAAWKRILEEGSVATFGKQLDDVPTNTGSEIWDYGMQLQDEIPFTDWRGMRSKKGAFSETVSELAAKSGFKPYEGTGEALRRAGLFVRRYMAPAQLQTTDNPIANKIRIVSKEMLEHGEQKVQRSILGTPVAPKGSHLKSSFFGPEWADNGSIAARARALAKSPEEWDGFIRTIQSGRGWRYGVNQYGLTERAVQLLRQIEAEDSILSRSIIAAQRAAGVAENKIFKPREHHFMLSRTWKGDWRVPVFNERGNLVYIAGGANKTEAERIAAKIVSEQNQAGRQWKVAPARSNSEVQDMEMLKKLITDDVDFRNAMRIQQGMLKKNPGQPGTFQQRQDVAGYQTEFDGDDFIRAMIQHGRRYRRFEAETAIRSIFRKDLKQLQFDDPEAFTTLMQRLDKVFNKEGQLTQAINQAFDTVLAPVLGKNSASRITGAANKLLYRYALGFANIGYAVATLGTFVQTAFPMMSLVNTLAHKAPERLARYTTYQPVFSEKGARVLGTVDSLKIAGQSWKELGNPDEILRKNLARAAEEGTTDPRFIDEWVGQTAVNKQRFKGVLEGKEPFTRFLEAAADTLPAITERHARGHSFAMGHIFYRDIMGVTDPDILYRLAKDFTEKTQYMYSAGDRAQIFNGPLGGMFGLFKNWMSHYMGWMLAYMGEGYRYGNWKPLLWMMAGTSSLGGIGALPFIGTADDLNKAFGNDTMLMQLYEMQGGADPDGINMADAIYYGLPGLLGVSIQGTVSAPLADPGADIIRMMSFAHYNQATKIANAVGPVVDAMESRGQYFISDPEARRALLNATAPKTMIRMAQAFDGPDLRSMNNGNTMVSGLSPIQRALWGMSLNPTKIEAQFELSRDLWASQNKMRERVGYYGQQLANMYESRDLQAVRRLMIQAMVEGVPMDSIQRSAEARQRRQETGLIEAQFDEAVIRRMQMLGIL
jgi:hypothetical protein